ncbi:hypothetical protein [Sphingobacterium daejeonense]|uniref:hypothetical protein n=1 Tax=Sphingobacterium daejeonense TaxID=371142 RepID=UPI0010C36601|nr:hypothetical protein [Sphingobacterium daejeonense]VTP91324.1 Uncharacterised protein [Sphingobacterium daejeonense]
MIPEHFKQNISLEIDVFGFPVQVDYKFYWPEKRENQKDPLISHIEYRAESYVISETGYRSHFFHTKALEETDYKTIEELVTAIGEHLALDNGYNPPTRGQMRLF